MVTDYSPGYGSAAKFVATVVKEIICDATVYSTNYVTIVEIMGRNTGWLTAAQGLSGVAVTLVRIFNNPYQCKTGTVEIEKIANFEKKIPTSWINDTHTDMIEPFLDYARPLIQAELPAFYVNGLPYHISNKQ